MVNVKDESYFENKLLDELRTFAHCKNKSKDPNHFCSNREIQKNLRIEDVRI